MTIWIDAQFSPTIAKWLADTYSIEAVAVRDLQLREAKTKRSLTLRGKPTVVMTALHKNSKQVAAVDGAVELLSLNSNGVRKFQPRVAATLGNR